MFSSPGRSTIRVKRGSDVRKTNEAMKTSVLEDAVQITLHMNRLMSFVSSTWQVLNTEIDRASYKSLTSNAVCYYEFMHARCDLQAN